MAELSERTTVVSTLIERTRAEYVELPGLVLTPSQMQRLIGATPLETASVIEELLHQGFLRRTRDGRFTRS